MESKFGLVNVWLQGDWVTRSVALLLLGMSLASWIVIVVKAIDLFRYRRLAGGADAHQGVVDAPDGTEQAHERRRRAHRSQHRQTSLQPGGGVVDRVAQAAGDPVAHVQRVMQFGARRALAVAHMGGGFAAFDGQLAKRVVGGPEAMWFNVPINFVLE